MAYFLAIILLLGLYLNAKDFGTYGTTYRIGEDDLLVILHNRLEEIQMNEQKFQEMQKSFAQAAKEPKGKKLLRATARHQFLYDPTIILNKDIHDEKGNILVAKGTKINPLDLTLMKEDLIFFDGEDDEQLSWAKNQQGKWIITKGKPLELEEKENRAVYFDQRGYLTNKIGIQALPAIVSQESNQLKVTEIPLSEFGNYEG